MRFLVIFLTTVSVTVFSADLVMLENGGKMNPAPIEIVLTPNPDTILIRSHLFPCPFYPKDIYGDLYECTTSRQTLSALLESPEILSASTQEISNILSSQSVRLVCESKFDPVLLKYQGKKVYYFSGPLVLVEPH